MLYEMMRYCRNFFVRSCWSGKFEVKGGTIDLPLKDGQYFLVEGSIFNDGVHTYPDFDLADEEFEGYVYGLAIPPEFVRLSEEIQTWVEKYRDVINSPYQSESFGGYTYSKIGGNTTSGDASSLSWQKKFSASLNNWRKL